MQDLHLLSVIRHRARRLIRPTLFVQRRRHFSAEVIRNMALKSAGFTLLALSLFQSSHRGGKLHPHIDVIDLIVKKSGNFQGYAGNKLYSHCAEPPNL